MKNLLLTISTTALLLVGQSAMALNEDSSGYELLNTDTSQSVEIPVASFRNDNAAILDFSGGNEGGAGTITSTFEANHAGRIPFNGGNDDHF